MLSSCETTQGLGVKPPLQLSGWDNIIYGYSSERQHNSRHTQDLTARIYTKVKHSAVPAIETQDVVNRHIEKLLRNTIPK